MTGRFVTRTRDGFVFGDARLSTGWTWRRGQIHRAGRVWTVSPTDPHRTGVTLLTGSGEAIRLHPRDSHVPGSGGQARWLPGRRTGRLSRDGQQLTLRLPAFGRGPVHLDVTGTWPELDLVALTAVFALMTRRRLLALRIIAVAGATGHS